MYDFKFTRFLFSFITACLFIKKKRSLFPTTPSALRPPGFVPDHTVYTDGGYRRMQGVGGAKPKKLASMGVYFGPDDPRNVAAEGRVQFLHVPAHKTGQDAHSVGNRAAGALVG